MTRVNKSLVVQRYAVDGIVIMDKSTNEEVCIHVDEAGLVARTIFALAEIPWENVNDGGDDNDLTDQQMSDLPDVVELANAIARDVASKFTLGTRMRELIEEYDPRPVAAKLFRDGWRKL